MPHSPESSTAYASSEANEVLAKSASSNSELFVWHDAANPPYLSTNQRRGYILQLKHSQRGQLLVDALEHVVVQVPGLVQLCLFA